MEEETTSKNNPILILRFNLEKDLSWYILNQSNI